MSIQVTIVCINTPVSIHGIIHEVSIYIDNLKVLLDIVQCGTTTHYMVAEAIDEVNK